MIIFHLLIQYIFGLLQISFNVGQELMNGFFENNLETELINPENHEDIIKSEVINQNGEFLHYSFRSDMS